MLCGKKLSYKKIVAQGILCSLGLFCFCEYLIYYVVLMQCRWPNLDPRKADPAITVTTPEEKPVQAMFIADTHLLGPRKGHWLDKLKREWQMYRAFQTAITLHNPDVVFFLGDIFDEGSWCGSMEFDNYVKRFHSMFSVPENTRLYVVAGNHDMGFHYVITPYLNQRFVNGMKAPNVRRVTIRGNHFVLLNSMALEGDGCFLCRSTEIGVNRIAKQLKCAQGIGGHCTAENPIRHYSRPIILQHYPMYRESDAICNEVDEAPAEIKDVKFREHWECLSKEASEQLFEILNPRLVVDGHTHHGCRKVHGDDILEITIPSFSWRNKDNPSFLMAVFTPNNYAYSKCYMPVESTVHQLYVIGIICIVIFLTYKIRQQRRRHCFFKVH
ncbi:metallophosphoesterase 1 [Venturia canescens]|uniref:metallophosphoesterase 1 n=1 Tax=Venturia canescens TaxID=32260 RepID=UPI001C9CA991|nr:metallophosphoesterase 1 [Venturia canescens]